MAAGPFMPIQPAGDVISCRNGNKTHGLRLILRWWPHDFRQDTACEDESVKEVNDMNSIIYLVGLMVVILAILAFIGIR